MPADFPSTPTLNQTYTFGGRTWTWNGTGWQLVANSTDKLTLTDGLVVPAASAATPSVRFTGSLSTGVYSPGADQVAISTGGTERLRIDNAGQIGIGSGGTAAGYSILQGKAITGATVSYGYVSQGVVQSDVTSAANLFVTSPSTVASAFTLSNLNHYVAQQGSIGAGSTVSSQIGFQASSNLTGATNNYGFVSNIASGTGRWGFYANGTADSYFASNNFIFANGGTEKARVDSSGRLGLGTSAPGALLHLRSSAARMFCENSSTGETAEFGVDATGALITAGGAKSAVFYTNGTERFRCDSSGRLLVGTSSARSTQFFQMEGPGYESSSSRYTRYSNDALSGGVILAKTRGTTAGSNTIVAADDRLGRVEFQGTDGAGLITAANIDCFVDGTPGTNDMPGRLVFATTADGASSPTERMRIDSAGRIGIGTAPTNATTIWIGRNPTGNSTQLGVYNSGIIQSDVTNTNYYFITAAQTAAASFTLTGLVHYGATQGSVGAGSAITNQYGFFAENNLIGATNNYGFFSNIASGTGRWGFYANGTAQNYFAGNVGIGVTVPSTQLHVSGASGNVTVRTQSGSSYFDITHNGTDSYLTTTTGAIQFWQSSTERARIDSSGRLLLGTSTDSGGALLQVNGDRIRVGSSKTPASASATGTAGEICWDASYIYVCTATNTWKRAAIASW